jgi:hypothetical protein
MHRLTAIFNARSRINPGYALILATIGALDRIPVFSLTNGPKAYSLSHSRPALRGTSRFATTAELLLLPKFSSPTLHRAQQIRAISTTITMSAPLTPEELERYTAIIDDILETSDLETISRKTIRKGLENALGGQDLSENKVCKIYHDRIR